MEMRRANDLGEEILSPDLPICDSHHHLWHLPSHRYLLDEYLADVNSGHRIESSIYVEAGSFYRSGGPPSLRAVGEIEFANGVAAMGESGRYGATRVAAGIVGHADLGSGAQIRGSLIAMQRAAGGRLVGIRHSGAWDSSPQIKGGRLHATAELYRQPTFRAGFAELKFLDLSFDAFLNHPQLLDLVDLAGAFPEQRIVLDHAGGLLGVGPYADRHDQTFVDWRMSIIALAECPNVYLKLGGLGISRCGFGFHKLTEPPSSQRLADTWRPWIETCILAFGVNRCMFESNFPVDKRSISYATLWNAYKRLAAGLPVEAQQRLFRDTAMDFYRLAKPDADAVAGGCASVAESE